MNKKQATRSINNLITESKGAEYQNKAWVIKVESIIQEIFGGKSLEYRTLITGGNAIYGNLEYYYQEKAKEFSELLPSFAETLLAKGPYKAPKVNFLSSLSDSAIATIFTVIIPLIFTAGGYFGNLYSDKQNIELRERLKSLSDTISSLRVSALPNSNPIPKGDTNKRNNKAVK